MAHAKMGKKSGKPAPPPVDYVLIRVTSAPGKYATLSGKGDLLVAPKAQAAEFPANEARAGRRTRTARIQNESRTSIKLRFTLSSLPENRRWQSNRRGTPWCAIDRLERVGRAGALIVTSIIVNALFAGTRHGHSEAQMCAESNKQTRAGRCDVQNKSDSFRPCFASSGVPRIQSC